MSKYTKAEEHFICFLTECSMWCRENHLTNDFRTAIEALQMANRLEYAYHNAFGIDLAKCTKYGNESAEQQRDSYSTVMMYEVANVFDDILGE